MLDRVEHTDPTVAESPFKVIKRTTHSSDGYRCYFSFYLSLVMLPDLVWREEIGNRNRLVNLAGRIGRKELQPEENCSQTMTIYSLQQTDDIEKFGSKLNNCLSADEFARGLNDCLSVDEFTSELNDCLSFNEFAGELTDCLSVDKFTRTTNNGTAQHTTMTMTMTVEA